MSYVFKKYGENGVLIMGVEDAEINESGELVFTYSDGTKDNVGVVVGQDGKPGATGPQGPKGEKGDAGESGVTVPVSGFFTLSVDAGGNLYAYTADGSELPAIEYDETTGNLYYNIEEN